MAADPLLHAVVRLRSADGTSIVGAGLLVTDTNILTCAHVISQALGHPSDALDPPDRSVIVEFLPFELVNQRLATVCAWFPENQGDIAGLVLDSPAPNSAQPISLVHAENLWGHEFRTFGFPESSPDGIWTYGTLRAAQGNNWLQIESTTGSPVQFGYSGAPVWDVTLAAVVGMVATAAGASDEGVAFAIRANALMNTWPEILKPPPYRGLRAFREEDSPDFFGREQVVEELCIRMRDHCLLTVLGPSGSGKSSVVTAGLAATLRKEAWAVAHLEHPGRSPFRALGACMPPADDLQPGLSAGVEEIDRRAALLRSGRFADLLAESHRKAGWNRLLIVIDQFEELFTPETDPDERRKFLDVIAEVPGYDRSGGFRLAVVVVLRIEFIGQALEHAAFARALNEDTSVHLWPMSARSNNLRDVVEKPAYARGVVFEPGLVDRIVDDAGEGTAQLPLVEELLTLLWDRRHGQLLTHAAYRELGGVSGALAQHANQVYANLSPEERKRARTLITRLVQLGKGMPDTRQIAYRRDLSERDWDLAERLASDRLLVTDRDPVGEQTAQLCHDALIRNWERLNEWLTEDRDFLEWLQQMRGRVEFWVENEHDNGALLHERRLDEALPWCLDHPEQIDGGVLELVARSCVDRATDLYGLLSCIWPPRRKKFTTAFEQGYAISRSIAEPGQRMLTLGYVLQQDILYSEPWMPIRLVARWNELRDLRKRAIDSGLHLSGPDIKRFSIVSLALALITAISWVLVPLVTAFSHEYLLTSGFIAFGGAVTLLLRIRGIEIFTAFVIATSAVFFCELAAIYLFAYGWKLGLLYSGAIALVLALLLTYLRIRRSRLTIGIKGHLIPLGAGVTSAGFMAILSYLIATVTASVRNLPKWPYALFSGVVIGGAALYAFGQSRFRYKEDIGSGNDQGHPV